MKKLLIILAAGAVIAGAAVWRVSGAVDQRADRNKERIARLSQWQPLLSGNAPEGRAVVDGSKERASIITRHQGPSPVRPDDTFFYHGTAGQFVICGALENTDPVSLVTSPQNAYFVTRQGGFTGPGRACTNKTAANVTAIAAATTMTDRAAELYLTADPVIADKATLQKVCADSVHDPSAQVQFSGCFTGRIYILRLEQPDIAAEMNVIGAHEMLHAAYQKLSTEERGRLDGLLREAQATVKDASLDQEVALYNAPDRVDELHSRLGSEVANLPAELESYYRRYFRDRASFVAGHRQYKQRLDSLTAELERLEARLDALKKQADAHQAAGRIDQFNALVDPYNNLLGRYNQTVNQYNALTAHTRPEPGELQNR